MLRISRIVLRAKSSSRKQSSVSTRSKRLACSDRSSYKTSSSSSNRRHEPRARVRNFVSCLRMRRAERSLFERNIENFVLKELSLPFAVSRLSSRGTPDFPRMTETALALTPSRAFHVAPIGECLNFQRSRNSSNYGFTSAIPLILTRKKRCRAYNALLKCDQRNTRNTRTRSDVFFPARLSALTNLLA